VVAGQVLLHQLKVFPTNFHFANGQYSSVTSDW
jgi:hypothetical protein